MHVLRLSALLTLAGLAAASSAAAAPRVDALSALTGLQRGRALTLRVTADDPSRPVSGFTVDFGEPGSAFGASACRTGAAAPPFRPGAPATLTAAYAFATAGVHLVTVRVLSGGCAGGAASTTVQRLVTVTPPRLPLPLPLPPVLGTVARRRGCRGAHLMPRHGNGSKVAAAVLCLVNRERARAGLHRLGHNADLGRAATAHSVGMVTGGTFAHGAVLQRLRSARYVPANAAWVVGENLAFGYGSRATAAATVASWMRSPEHKANILDRSFRDAGVGVALGIPGHRGIGATYTLDFGARH